MINLDDDSFFYEFNFTVLKYSLFIYWYSDL